MEPFSIKFSVETTNPHPLNLTFRLHKEGGVLLATINNQLDDYPIQAKENHAEGSLQIEQFCVLPGKYVLVAIVQDGPEYLYRMPAIHFQVSSKAQESDLFQHGVVHVPHQWSS